jgi:hypothetical protein
MLLFCALIVLCVALQSLLPARLMMLSFAAGSLNLTHGTVPDAIAIAVRRNMGHILSFQASSPSQK